MRVDTVSGDSGITLINARLSGSPSTTVRIVGSRIAAVGELPQARDAIVDLEGDRVFPGLINAHDHLQLNSLDRHASCARFRHVREWISEVDARRRSDTAFDAAATVARDDRLLIGGMKNILSGVTTVAHHDPLYPFLIGTAFPTRVVQNYGWAHSLYMDGEERVRSSHRATPTEWPWIIHAAEGLDHEAGNEFERLDALGCLAPNTLIVHGVALDSAQRARLVQAGAGLIWCPSSNLNLFDRTAEVADLVRFGRIALGTDSRLSGAGDLLQELRVAAETGGFDERTLAWLVSEQSAKLLRLHDRGVIRPGALADLLILPAAIPLGAAGRADVRLVLIDGAVRYGDEDCAERFSRAVTWANIRVDGRPKVLDERIAALVRRSQARELGLEFCDAHWRAA